MGIGARVDAGLTWLDDKQQGARFLSFPVAVIRRYGDNHGSSLAALTTFYGFLSVFPTLLLLVVAVQLVAPKGSSIQRSILESAFAQFPVVGHDLADNLRSGQHRSGLALVASVGFLLWGSLGITSTLQLAASTIWRVPRHARPDWWRRMLWGLAILLLLAAVVLATSFLTAATSLSATWLGADRVLIRVALLLGAGAVNIAGYAAAITMLSPRSLRHRSLIAGAAFGGIAWTVVQALGGILVGHELSHASRLFGYFGVVIGLIFWVTLGARIFLYALEVTAVTELRAWPRSLREQDASLHADPFEFR